jgi:hypothetical protein
MLLFMNDERLDNTHRPPSEVAQRVIDRFGLALRDREG